MSPARKFMRLATAFALFAGCARDMPDDDEWVAIFEDDNQAVAFAPAHIDPHPEGWYTVWYRTDHHRSRSRNGEVWHREITRALLRCDGLWFKIREVDLLDGSHVVSRQRASEDELERQPWQLVAEGTSEEEVAAAVCRHVGEPELHAAKR